jgi:hypothetical protein
VSYLRDEYKILQDKIDKIGAFRFTIKGWSVTAVVGGLIAGSSTSNGSPRVIGLILDLCLVFFFLFEREQVVLSRRFGKRARQIEIHVDARRRRLAWKNQVSSPRIARLIARGKPFDLIPWSLPRPEWEVRRSRLNEQFRIAWKAHIVFYAALVLVSWLPAWFWSRDVRPPSQNMIIYGGSRNTSTTDSSEEAPANPNPRQGTAPVGGKSAPSRAGNHDK